MNNGQEIIMACMKVKGLSEDSREMKIMQEFFDGWLRNQPGGGDILAEYARHSKKILENIKKTEDAETIYAILFEKQVLPCIHCIEEGNPEWAFLLYQEMILKLLKRYVHYVLPLG